MSTWAVTPFVGLAHFVALVSLLASLPGCSESPTNSDRGPAFEPTDPVLLSAGSPTKDEDPSVVLARDGKLVVAWFSDRSGNGEIYITSTSNGVDWTSPVQVTTNSGGDFNPNLFQDAQGTFHLTWFRWEALFRGHIWYNSSVDGSTWDPNAEVQVTTTADVDDWVPTITQAADGTLLVYFVSERRDTTNPTAEVYVATRRPGLTSWDPAIPVANVNSATENDHLPFAARTGAEITLAWVRHDTTQALPWLNPKSDLFCASSSDGVTFSVARKITNDAGNIVHLFPTLYSNLDAQWSLVWLSTRLGPPRVFELGLDAAANYPQALLENTALPPGYSHRIAPTPTAGVYIGVWVQGPDGAQDIYYRFFRGHQ